MLERAIMIYLALATVATAAIFPLPLRTTSPMPREHRPPTEPPTPTRLSLIQRSPRRVRSRQSPCRGWPRFIHS